MSINVLRMTSKFFKLLSDVNVLKIILLLKNNEKSFQVIQNNLNITQSHQSHLMRKLIDSNILIVRREQRKKIYKIKNKIIYRILGEAKGFLTEIQKEKIDELKDFNLYDI